MTIVCPAWAGMISAQVGRDLDDLDVDLPGEQRLSEPAAAGGVAGGRMLGEADDQLLNLGALAADGDELEGVDGDLLLLAAL